MINLPTRQNSLFRWIHSLLARKIPEVPQVVRPKNWELVAMVLYCLSSDRLIGFDIRKRRD